MVHGRRRAISFLLAIMCCAAGVVAIASSASAATRSGTLHVTTFESTDGATPPQFTLDTLPVVPANADVSDDLVDAANALVTLNGTMANGTFVASGIASVLAIHPSAAFDNGERRVAVVIGQYAGSAPTATVEQARSIVYNGPDSLDAYFRQVYGRNARMIAGLHDETNGDVFGPFAVTTPSTKTRCATDTVVNEFKSLQATAGQNGLVGSYQNVIYFLPNQAGCSLRGLGQLRGPVFATRDAKLAVVAHEFGHNIGLLHAGGIRCFNAGGSVVSLAGASGHCNKSFPWNYADPFDEMGNRALAPGGAVREYNALHKIQIGALPIAASSTATRGTHQYLVQTSDYPYIGHAQALTIPRNAKQEFVIDYRSRRGHFDNFATGDPILAGVSVRLHQFVVKGQGGDTLLVDSTPGSRSSVDDMLDAPLQVGRSIHDPVSGVTIRLDGMIYGFAAVTVTVP